MAGGREYLSVGVCTDHDADLQGISLMLLAYDGPSPRVEAGWRWFVAFGICEAKSLELILGLFCSKKRHRINRSI